MQNSVSIVLVAFNPDYNILNRCLNSIPNDIKVLIIDNSQNLKINKINNFSKKEISIIKSENYGNGHAINLGLELSKTKYILYLDLDTILTENFIYKILEHSSKIEDFAILAPCLKNYSYKKQDYKFNINLSENYHQMNFIEGAVMFFNKEKLNKYNIKFDKNIFLYWEESDLFFDCHKKKQKIFLIKDLFAYHEGGASINKEENPDIELNRNWHIMWSKFYYYKKNYNFFIAFKKTIKHFLSALIKFIIYSITKNKKKDIYFERLNGLYNAYVGKNSWRRPKI